MRTTTASCAIVLLMVGAACGSPDATSPATTNSPSGFSVPAQPSYLPKPSGPSRIFVFNHELSYPVSAYTKDSRFVLYDDGAFALEFGENGLAYRGGYSESKGVIVFGWEGWSSAGAWGATGALKGDTLTVQYNIIMLLTDFEDAAYVRR